MGRKQAKRGQGLVEYVLIVALIGLVCVAMLTAMGGKVGTSLFGNISSNLDKATSTVTGS